MQSRSIIFKLVDQLEADLKKGFKHIKISEIWFGDFNDNVHVTVNVNKCTLIYQYKKYKLYLIYYVDQAITFYPKKINGIKHLTGRHRQLIGQINTLTVNGVYLHSNLYKGTIEEHGKYLYNGTFDLLLNPIGYGKITCNHGDTYEGNWTNIKSCNKLRRNVSVWDKLFNSDILGFIIITYNNGDTYEGYMNNGDRQGKGKYLCSDGEIYDGDWNNDNIHGYGMHLLTNGEKYEGEWINNRKIGLGKYTYIDGSIYDGELINDQKTGWGMHTYIDGSIYSGEWIYGQYHGKGVFYCKQTNILTSGYWKYDLFVKGEQVDFNNKKISFGTWNNIHMLTSGYILILSGKLTLIAVHKGINLIPNKIKKSRITMHTQLNKVYKHKKKIDFLRF